ncbi:MAG: DUF4112 domain-containing protein [Sulfitobacter sp.]|nr:DUF4112 domain-containing protein [Sulfitobacter sp.]
MQRSTLSPPDHSADLARLKRLAHQMDSACIGSRPRTHSAFRVPVLGFRVGWDGILGLVPGIGDVLALAPSAYIIKEAHRMGAPSGLLMRMGVNSGIDAFLGTIPLVGDIFDVAWKSKIRNVSLLERHLEAQTLNAKGAAHRQPLSENRSVGS